MAAALFCSANRLTLIPLCADGKSTGFPNVGGGAGRFGLTRRIGELLHDANKIIVDNTSPCRAAFENDIRRSFVAV